MGFQPCRTVLNTSHGVSRPPAVLFSRCIRGSTCGCDGNGSSGRLGRPMQLSGNGVARSRPAAVSPGGCLSSGPPATTPGQTQVSEQTDTAQPTPCSGERGRAQPPGPLSGWPSYPFGRAPLSVSEEFDQLQWLSLSALSSATGVESDLAFPFFVFPLW